MPKLGIFFSVSGPSCAATVTSTPNIPPYSHLLSNTYTLLQLTEGGWRGDVINLVE